MILTVLLAGSLQVFYAEKKLPATAISMYCGECHDGSIATLPRVNVLGSHKVDGATGMTCLSCHKSNDPKPTPWRCCECHGDICGTSSSSTSNSRGTPRRKEIH